MKLESESAHYTIPHVWHAVFLWLKRLKKVLHSLFQVTPLYLTPHASHIEPSVFGLQYGGWLDAGPWMGAYTSRGIETGRYTRTNTIHERMTWKLCWVGVEAFPLSFLVDHMQLNNFLAMDPDQKTLHLLTPKANPFLTATAVVDGLYSSALTSSSQQTYFRNFTTTVSPFYCWPTALCCIVKRCS